MPAALLLALVGILPGLIVFLIVQRTKRYSAECPNCGQQLLLKMNEAEPVKSAWGGAQFYDSNGETIANGTVLARAGKWLLIGAAGLVGLLVCLGLAGVAFQKLGIVQRVETSSPPVDTGTPGASAQTSSVAPLGTRQSQRAVVLRSYAGRVPDKAFWDEVGAIFVGNLVGMGSGASMALESFDKSLEQYSFSPCAYDANTDSMTVTWKTTRATEEGDIAGGLGGVHAISFRVTDPGAGTVATWDDSTTPASMTLYGHDQISPSDVASLKKGDFRSVPPALGRWAAEVIRQSGKDIQLTVE